MHPELWSSSRARRLVLTGDLVGGELESQHSARAELSSYREVTNLRSYPYDRFRRSCICFSGMPTRAGLMEGLRLVSLL